MAEKRVDLDPLDVPLSRNDVLELLRHYTERSMGTHREILFGMERDFRREWSKPPVPEKFVPPVVDSEAHDG